MPAEVANPSPTLVAAAPVVVAAPPPTTTAGSAASIEGVPISAKQDNLLNKLPSSDDVLYDYDDSRLFSWRNSPPSTSLILTSVSLLQVDRTPSYT